MRLPIETESFIRTGTAEVEIIGKKWVRTRRRMQQRIFVWSVRNGMSDYYGNIRYPHTKEEVISKFQAHLWDVIGRWLIRYATRKGYVLINYPNVTWKEEFSFDINGGQYEIYSEQKVVRDPEFVEIYGVGATVMSDLPYIRYVKGYAKPPEAVWVK